MVLHADRCVRCTISPPDAFGATLPSRAGESLLAFATYCFDLRTGF
jgi:hypothetical protein